MAQPLLKSSALAFFSLCLVGTLTSNAQLITRATPVGWVSLGCYNDSVQARSLSNGVAVLGGPSNMTNENCAAACQSGGYLLAGTEYSAECYCANTFSNNAAPVTDGRCSMTCNGNTAEICGGSNGLSVLQYKGSGTTRSTSTATPTPSSSVNPAKIAPFKYQGCYTDTGNGRSITEQIVPDNQTMTVEYCVSVCSSNNYTIAGLQYGIQCFCDDYLHSSPQLVSDSQCNMACGGNSGEICGAASHNSVYSNGPLQNYSAPGPVPQSSLPTSWSYSGCYLDNVNNTRVFPYQLNFPTNNSNTLCINTCKAFGYTAAGTEYANQCFCGDWSDVVNSGSQKLAETSCFMRCSNESSTANGGTICGGGGALSIYTTSAPFNKWTYGSGNAAGEYQFLIGGVVIPLVTQPARNGKIVYMEKSGTEVPGYDANGNPLPPNSTGTYELDLALINNFTAAWRPLHVKTDIFCSASLTLPDRVGRQINVGGWSLPSTQGIRLYWPDGSPGVPGTNDWQENVDELALLDSRWYPSAMIMSNGSILVMGGEQGSNGAPTPSLELLPRTNNQSQYCSYLAATDPYNLYPFLAVLPSGKIFVGYYNQALLLDPVSLQPVRNLPQIPAAVNNAGGGRSYPMEGSAVLLPQKAPYTDLTVLICGGSTTGAAIALDNCVSIHPDDPKGNWTIERMPSKRVMPCMAALPDGTYLIANGAHQGNAGFGLATSPNLNAILYDPSKPLGQRMTVMANTTVARLYHSEAVLMDDGRVLISGSDPEDKINPQEFRNEVFIPPYLMGNPARPAFNLTNLDWAYGQQVSFPVTAPGAGGTYRVSMMGSVASTHGNSMGQRTFFLTTTCSGTTCTATAPPNNKVCPPGWFQLFLLDGKGVPSHATWIRVGGDPANLGNWPNFPDFSRPGVGAVTPLF